MTHIPLALYIHIPWCIRKCPYCDFNSHAAASGLPESAYVQALLANLASELPHVWGRKLESIFIGGGTPSLFSAESIDELLCGIRALMPFRPNLEVTLEANPGTFEQDKFRGFREAGINRLSVGIQSFNPTHLQALGRVHNREEALRAADIARTAGFDNFNLDLMFGLPQQTLAEAMQDLQQAMDLQPTHLSWYQLTLEPNTLFYKQPPPLPDDDLVADMQFAGQTLLNAANYQQYEVSAYAQPQQQCRHNRNYWEFGDYLAIGAGAHGKITHPADGSVTRYHNYRQPSEYLQHAPQGNARSGTQTLTTVDLSFEFMLNALRLRDGFALPLFSERTGLSVEHLQTGLDKAVQRGLLSLTGEQVQPTEHGWQFLNEVMQLFLED
ncbi:radical SAM family heme chaperone HemW [Candidatus Thiothrix anitrata]|uniref:Heme chaperone HemW n=1 Tax=Candidatus Thiothrix anitrata TaxID=2823902 RepID=A0ABX7X7D8_9GAMM|nr:radical SAM family heme chaperone HemW [Candidatus Thiothrix anitrata]QTR50039.1 oxygen-independent coproporphyrinogen III oxidase-like protein [Candidatus Thiothrix anitrata]